MKEADLAQPVAVWLENKGYEVYSEVPLGYGGARVIDIIGKADSTIIAIELKLSLTQQVLYQAHHCQLVAHKVFVAVATNPTKRSVEACRKSGVGIISVKNSKAEMILEPEGKEIITDRCNNLKERLKYISKGVYTGKPNEKGVGPAQDCCRRIKEYLDVNPQASWKEIYKNVDNHYSSCNTMQSSMRNWCHFRKSKHIRNRQIQMVIL